MIDLYYWTTPNGHKITMALEELGLDYRLIPVNLWAGEQKRGAFRAIAPNGRIPAIVDTAAAGGATVSLSESGAILLYLAEKVDGLLPRDVGGRAEALQWLFWQVGGLGPISGHNGHFAHYAPDPLPYAILRFVNETGRLYGVMDRRLADRDYLAGAYSIADIACYPWIVPYARLGQRLADFPNLERWFKAVAARPATVRAYGKADEVPEAAAPVSREVRQALFGG
jgi:GST-like protein